MGAFGRGNSEEGLFTKAAEAKVRRGGEEMIGGAIGSGAGERRRRERDGRGLHYFFLLSFPC